MTPFIGQIIVVGFNFAPRGFAFCDGQLLQIASNTALFSLLGTTYGGDGRTTFGLPDLRGRFPMHQGQGSGLSFRSQGQRGGIETTTLTPNNLPAHSHPASGRQAVVNGAGNSKNPAGRVPAELVRETAYSDGAATGFQRADSVEVSVGNAGGNQPFYNMPPFLVLNFVIALQGIFPSRS